jgi:anti-sigma-K factor RskA
MNEVILTWRPANIATIAVIVLALYLIVTFAHQVMIRKDGQKGAENA